MPSYRSPITTRVATATIVVLSGILAAFYALLQSNNYAYADDAFPFVVRLAYGEGVNVHHVILRVISLGLQAMMPSAHGNIELALVVLRSYVVLTSMLTLVLVGLLTYRWFGRRIDVAILSILTVAFGYGYWSYSIVPDIYIPSLAFALLSIFMADTASLRQDAAWRNSWIAGASFGVLLTALNHQAFVLVAVPITAALLLCAQRHRSVTSRLFAASFFIVSSSALVLGAFYLAYTSTESARSFVEFLRGYSGWMIMTPYDQLQILTPVYVLVGLTRAMIFPEYCLHFDGVYGAVHDRFALKVLFDERYLLRDMSEVQIALLTVANCLILTGLIIGVIVFLAGLFRGSARSAAKYPGYWMVLGWLAVQTALFVWWEPASNEFWIWFWPCVSLCGVGVLLGDPTASRPRPLLGLFILAMVVANTPVIAKYRNKDDCIYRANKVYLSATNENDVIVMAKFYPPNYLHYLHEPRPRIHFCEFGNFVAADSSLVADLDRAALTGGRAILDPMLTMPEETELAQMRFFVSGDRDTVEVALRSLVGSCRARGVPVLAVHRTGEPWATYAPYDLGPGVAWTDPELRPIASE